MPSTTKVRGGFRGQITQEFTAVQDMLDGSIEANMRMLERAETKINGYLAKIYALDEEILQEYFDADQQQKAHEDSKQATIVTTDVLKKLTKIREKIDEMKIDAAADFSARMNQQTQQSLGGGGVATASGAVSGTSSSVQPRFQRKMKLPKLGFKHFSGNYLEYQTFRDIFKVSVDDDPGLSDIEKFSYLLDCLKGEALTMVEGYELTSAYYKLALDSLDERYGNPQRIQFGHFQAIVALETARNNLTDLQRLFDQFEKHLRCLVALGVAEEAFAIVLIPILLAKLPTPITMELHRKNEGGEWKLENVRKWLKAELRAQELTHSVMNAEADRDRDRRKSFAGSNNAHNSYRGEQRGGSTSSMMVANSGRFQSYQDPRRFQNRGSSSKPPWCSYCHNDHFTDECRKFPTIADRKRELTASKRCFRCLSTLHLSSQCTRDVVCPYCQRRDHHRSLCWEKFGNVSRPRPQNFEQNRGNTRKPNQLNIEATEFIPPADFSGNVAIASDAHHTTVSFLPTALTYFVNEQSQVSHQGRVLLDTAGSRSFITEEMCHKLGLAVIGQSCMSVGRFGSSKRTTSVTKRVQVGVRCVDGSIVTITASVIPVISSPVSRFPIDTARYPIVTQVPMAEPLSRRPDSLPLDLLIGTDFYYQFVIPWQVIPCDSGKGPILVNSRFGYLVAGTMPVPDREGSEVENNLILLLTESTPGHRDPYDALDLERFWKLEEVGVSEKKAGKEISDEQAWANFYSTLKFKDGRYWVKWLWKCENPKLADNSKLSFGRLISVFNRLKKTPEILQKYDQTIRDQLKLDVIEEAPKTPTGVVYYVPHHEVITPSKVTTRLRVVYDASSKINKNELSLNDCMHRGIVVLEDLCGLLIRFRTWRYGIVADIEKAFLQIGLQETERDVARFYWVRDIGKPLTKDNIVVYRFKRVFFGAMPSPSILGSTLDAHARRIESSSDVPTTREMAKAFRDNMYSDNHVGGEDNEEKAVVHYRETKKLCQDASMNLREFYTNSGKLRNHMKPEDIGKSLSTKVLGVVWDLEKDNLRCADLKSSLTTSVEVTKRDIVREVARVFDPCGWFAPVVLPAKLLIQQLWKGEFEWDERLPREHVEQWLKHKENLSRISLVEIPRYVGGVRQAHQIHAFCDASAKASAAVVYLRTVVDGKVVCHLLMSKTRLAPISPEQTIPRLELIAVEMGVRLIEFASEHLRGVEETKFVWSDSQCVLAWSKNEKLTTKFVQRRIESIRAVEKVSYRFVSGIGNPADIPSRGCSLDSLARNNVWWHGPDWLISDESKWPATVVKPKSTLELTPETSNEVVLVVELGSEPPLDFSQFSTLVKAFRCVSVLQRCARNYPLAKADRHWGPFLLRDLAKARLTCEKWVQDHAFKDFEAWRTKKKVMPDHLRHLNLFRDQKGLIRCKSRMQNSDLPFDAQNPILLPKEGSFTQLAIRHAHERCKHALSSQTLAAIRERYWIVQGKNTVKRVIGKCQCCRRAEGGPYQIPPMPPLPEFRVSQNNPFAYTGLDYLGPIVVKSEDGSSSKVWIALFTCALSRAVHLEVVFNQSAKEFQLALRRFMAIFGTPLLIVSDNASQFVAVEKALRKLKNNPIPQDLATELSGVEWKFIPESSPWMGGFYERMVGVVKRFLKKALDYVVVTASELCTVAAEIEYIVNSRPLLTVDAEHSFRGLCPMI